MTKEHYDYIIVGAGSAGCVLANRLSENTRNKVLLLEAGGSDAKFWIKVPLGYAKTFADPKVNWRYSTAPDNGLNGRKSYWPRGRVIGGSGSINAMAYLRGLPHDFDDWEQAGAIGWGWNTVKEAYDAIESNSEIDPNGKRHVRGNGPLWVSDLSDQMHPFSRHFLKAAIDMGWPVSGNINDAENEGLSMVRSTVRKGRRWSTADAFLRPVCKRPNLHIATRALVERVVIDQGHARGVEYRIGERAHLAYAGKEVILSAGAINSPQLLQLSGIGPADLLKEHGLPVHHDLGQVGQGLQDHLAISHYFRATEPTLNNKLGNVFGQMMAGAHYLLTRSGPLSVPVNQVSGYVRSNPNVAAPDVQIYCNPMSYTTTKSGQSSIESEPGFLLCAQLSRPTSRGSVNIASADPTCSPIIQPNSLSTNEDRVMAVQTCKTLQALVKTPTIQAVTKERLAPDITEMNDDEMLENFRNRAGTVFHPSCTCRMGNNAKDSVLDANLKVHGVRGLRVVDASAFPNVTSGNTNAPTIMLAARAADIILQDA
jgi:choline dehydrogenase